MLFYRKMILVDLIEVRERLFKRHDVYRSLSLSLSLFSMWLEIVYLETLECSNWIVFALDHDLTMF